MVPEEAFGESLDAFGLPYLVWREITSLQPQAEHPAVRAVREGLDAIMPELIAALTDLEDTLPVVGRLISLAGRTEVWKVAFHLVPAAEALGLDVFEQGRNLEGQLHADFGSGHEEVIADLGRWARVMLKVFADGLDALDPETRLDGFLRDFEHAPLVVQEGFLGVALALEAQLGLVAAIRGERMPVGALFEVWRFGVQASVRMLANVYPERVPLAAIPLAQRVSLAELGLTSPISSWNPPLPMAEAAWVQRVLEAEPALVPAIEAAVQHLRSTAGDVRMVLGRDEHEQDPRVCELLLFVDLSPDQLESFEHWWSEKAPIGGERLLVVAGAYAENFERLADAGG